MIIDFLHLSIDFRNRSNHSTVDADSDVSRERHRVLSSRYSSSSSSSSSASSDVLHLAELTKSWDRKSAPAVDRLSLGVGAGEIVSLLGANRSGKSTALMVIAGDIDSTSGEVEWLYDKVTHLTEKCFFSYLSAKSLFI